MRNHNRRFYGRGYCADIGDVHTFASDQEERAEATRREISEDLEDLALADLREKAPG